MTSYKIFTELYHLVIYTNVTILIFLIFKGVKIPWSFFVYLLALIPFDIFGPFIASELKPSFNMLNLFTFISFPTLNYCIFRQLKSKKSKIILLGILVCSFTAFCFTIIPNFGKPKFDVNSHLIFGLQLIISCIVYFFDAIANPDMNSLLKSFAFWFCSAILIWSTLFIFRIGFMTYFIKNNPEFHSGLVNMLALINVIVYSLTAYALLCLRTARS